MRTQPGRSHPAPPPGHDPRTPPAPPTAPEAPAPASVPDALAPPTVPVPDAVTLPTVPDTVAPPTVPGDPPTAPAARFTATAPDSPLSRTPVTAIAAPIAPATAPGPDDAATAPAPGDPAAPTVPGDPPTAPARFKVAAPDGPPSRTPASATAAPIAPATPTTPTTPTTPVNPFVALTVPTALATPTASGAPAFADAPTAPPAPTVPPLPVAPPVPVAPLLPTVTPPAPAPPLPTGPGTPTGPAPRRIWPRSFADRLTAPLPGLRGLARFAREGAVRPRPEGLRDIPLLPFAPGPLPRADAGTVAVTWAGHASWVVRIGGLTVLTDPVWSRRILGTPARVTPVGVAWDALPPVDAVVISHNHYDHLDAATLRRLPRHTPVLVPAGLGRWFRARRFTRVSELDWWEATAIGGVRFDFVPAHHWSKRTLFDTCRSLWGGWVLTDADGRRLYFAGDTGYGHWFSRIGRRYPGIDLALLPIGAYDPRWWLRDVHCDPEEAVRAAQDLGARRMAPMHWATFVLSAEPVLEPLTRVRAAWRRAGLPRENLWDLPIGASRVLAG